MFVNIRFMSVLCSEHSFHVRWCAVCPPASVQKFCACTKIETDGNEREYPLVVLCMSVLSCISPVIVRNSFVRCTGVIFVIRWGSSMFVLCPFYVRNIRFLCCICISSVYTISFSFLGTFFFCFLPRGIVEMQSVVQLYENWSAGEMRSQIYLVESCTRPLMSVLCSVCPLGILYAFWLSGTCSLVVRHSFGDIWLVELKPCVAYSLPVRFNRSMSGECTSVVSGFLPDWPFYHRITKILIRLTFGGSIRSSVTGALACLIYCDTRNLFIMVISEYPWHSPFAMHLAVELSLPVLRLGSVAAGIRTPNLPHARPTL